MANVKVKTLTKAKPKSDGKVEEILATLKDKNIRLSMLECSEMVHKLVSTYRLKPTFIEKKTNFSLPHIYNLICLGSMTPKMKEMVISGKIKGTDALKILRRAKDEKEFIFYANELSGNKINLRKKEEPQPDSSERKEKLKVLLNEFIGNAKTNKSRTVTINNLVDQLITS